MLSKNNDTEAISEALNEKYKCIRRHKANYNIFLATKITSTLFYAKLARSAQATYNPESTKKMK